MFVSTGKTTCLVFVSQHNSQLPTEYLHRSHLLLPPQQPQQPNFHPHSAHSLPHHGPPPAQMHTVDKCRLIPSIHILRAPTLSTNLKSIALRIRITVHSFKLTPQHHTTNILQLPRTMLKPPPEYIDCQY